MGRKNSRAGARRNLGMVRLDQWPIYVLCRCKKQGYSTQLDVERAMGYEKRQGRLKPNEGRIYVCRFNRWHFTSMSVEEYNAKRNRYERSSHAI